MSGASEWRTPRPTAHFVNEARAGSESAGRYVIYRDGRRMYVWRAVAIGGLRKRLCGCTSRTKSGLLWSAFRRNAAEMHGIATLVTRAHTELSLQKRLAA